MKSILNLINDYIIVIDRYGNIEFCNEKILSKLSYTENDLVNLNISKILYEVGNDLKYKIKNIKHGEIINKRVSLFDSKKNIVELEADIIIEKYGDKEYIYIVLQESCKKGYDIEDLEVLLDYLPLDIWIKDLDGKYIFTNQQYANRMKCNKEYMIGKDNKFFWESKNKGNKFLEFEEEIIKNKIPRVSELFVMLENKKKYFEMYKAPIIDKNGNTKYTIGSSRDITLKKAIERGIYENNKILSRLDNISSYNKDEKNLDKLLDNIGFNMAESLETDGLAIFLYDEKDRNIKLKKIHGYMDLALKDINSIPIDESIKVKLLNGDIKILHNTGIKERRPIYNHKLNKKIEYSESYSLIVDKELIGIITLGYLEGNKPKFNHEEFINIACKEIAMIIKNYRLSNELKQEFEKRKQIENDLEVFLDISVDTMAVVDNKGDFVFISPTISKIMYWKENDVLNKNGINLVHPNDKTEVIRTFKKKSRNAIRKQNKFLCKNGEYKWLDWNYRYIEEKDCFVITARDITKEKKEEDQRKALEAAIQLESLKNEFFANISHEFKTPINIILGTMQLLDKYLSEDNETMRNEIDFNRYIKSTKQNAYRLLRLVNNLIDMTRIDTGFYELHLGNYNIINIIESITLSVAQYIENKGINLVFDTSEEEVILACDPDKIERIVLNILSNAIKYTDKDGNIFVNIDVRKDKVIVSIKDTGLGISKEKLPLIFERFRQGDYLLTRNCEGSGIGLSLVKSLVEMHEGRIYVTSQKGKGSEFIFELPIRLVENDTKFEEHVYEEFRIEKCNIEFSDIYSI